jgi:hypothetical protein
MIMALGEIVDVLTMGLMAIFLFFAVWTPCCTSDIVFPLLFSNARQEWAVRSGRASPTIEKRPS